MVKRIFISVLILSPLMIFAQNHPSKGIYKFHLKNKTYELVMVPKSWKEAASDAVAKGGYLAEINSQSEQDGIFNVLKQLSGINLKATIAPDGGGASYIWLGGNDLAKEGLWIWDGNNDGTGIPFWQGGVNGHPIGGHYTNWGHEPDNFEGHQNALGLALTEWPLGWGSLGQPGQWNDLNENNQLYYLIEFEP